MRACLAKTEEETTVPLCDYSICGTVVSKFWNLKETVICLGVTERNYHIQTGSKPELKQKEYWYHTVAATQICRCLLNTL